ncbi:hypothetical protein LRQ11_23620 [Pseudomonas sp. MAFF 311095]|uniref:Phage abortive infection protein n=1 Tax=Pseudomonas petroselini TaxID=2899822 RepID=A0ABS8QWH0_9PSED|nr:hypothetical protein [Pseudomonas petroselini]MCD7040049.1 hypothetical protein [Pseudomonas petroselini]MCD7046230.1 hypothetical protein [Pseudomonas petroselini]MCD7067674.1 hypothetical protein [Pseudomonas petroselini]MCD7081631.1 hypothetical protein [Pseudomonas petroselini]
MKKDWSIWLWCVLLFLAGVTWGSIKLKAGFFTVDNVRDLFEIFSSMATVAAVVLAALGINAWRSQIKAESDHGLARKLAVSLINFKDAIQAAHADMQFCRNNCIVGFEGLPPHLLRSVTDTFIVRMDKAKTLRAEILALLIEARALWGDELSNSFGEVINVCDEFYGGVRLFSLIIDPECEFERRELFKTRIIEKGDEFEADGWLEGKILSRADELSKHAYDYIKSKLLR